MVDRPDEPSPSQSVFTTRIGTPLDAADVRRDFRAAILSRLVGHESTLVTELDYRKQLRPVIQSGATVMDRLFAAPGWQLGWRGSWL